MKTLIDQLLEEQQSLTVVDRFAQKHSRGEVPLQQKYYRDLIPLSGPGPGQQYAFEVNLDSCSGCKACVSACHSLNGLEDNEAWRDVGLLVGSEVDSVYQQVVTTACHHCVEPGCLQGCPVAAYEKEPETGIVRHLDDQCIGCQYCVMKCPYDVPKYSDRLGIVRKCDMCHDRLSAEEAPACVQACPHQAIKITIVDRTDVVARNGANPEERLLPGAHLSSYTLPTTQYMTKKSELAGSRPVNHAKLKKEPAHFPLVVMLVFTQLAAGLITAWAALDFFKGGVPPYLGLFTIGLAFLALNSGLAAATFHLGRPLGAWRFFLGLRTSWMSREILAFAIFTGTVGVTLPAEFFWPGSEITLLLEIVDAVLGLFAVFTSAMIYIDTHRTFWNWNTTCVRFFGTVFILGSLGVELILTLGRGSISSESFVDFTGICLGFLTVVASYEEISKRWAYIDDNCSWHPSAQIQFKLQPGITYGILLLNFYSISFLSLATVWSDTDLWLPLALGLTFILSLTNCLLERYQFFTTVVAYRMPGQAT